jgi:peptidyl-dipeptidase Dcp
MEQARRRDLREELEFHEWTTAVEENRPLLVEGLAVRRRIAALLGYESWAHYAMEVRMAREPAAVRALYESLVPQLRLKAAGEFEVMTAALKAETAERHSASTRPRLRPTFPSSRSWPACSS